MNSGGKKYLHWFSSPDGASKSGCVGTNFTVKKLHINSLVLALKSPVFHRLFKSGMTKSQSQQRAELTIRIDASEEAALVDLLKFIYGSPLKATSVPHLVNVLIAAKTDGSETCTLDFEFMVMEKSSKQFTSLAKKENCRVIVHKRYASPDMFQMPWKDLMDDESKYFIDGILQL